MNDLKNELRRIRNLKQNRKKSDSVLEREAQLNVWERQINIESRFTDTKEQKLASQLFDNYIGNYTFESFNQITFLADLIYNEIMLKRIRDDINKISADKNNGFISDKLIGSLHSVEGHILELKNRLGIVKKDGVKDDLTALQEYEKKLDVYIAFNRNEFELEVPFVCKKCGHEDVEMHLLRRRCNKENFEVLKHPAFLGRWLYNTDMIDDVKAGELSKEKAAKYQHTSPKMIEYMIENEHKIIQVDGVPKEIVDNFVNKNPFLRSADEYNEK